jgi:hypothetical protein
MGIEARDLHVAIQEADLFTRKPELRLNPVRHLAFSMNNTAIVQRLILVEVCGTGECA